MTTTYEIRVRSPLGITQVVLDKFLSFDYQRVVNKVGTFKVVLPYGAYNTDVFVNNSIFELWRQVDNNPPYLEGETPFFLAYLNKKLQPGGVKILELTALDSLMLLDNRNIAYNAGTTYTDKTGKADDVVKAFVRENIGALVTDSARNLGSYVSVQVDLGACPTISKGASRRNLLTTLQEIAADSYTLGTYLAFDLVYLNAPFSPMFEFRTYPNFRGTDHSWPSGRSPVVLDPDNGNLVQVERAIDNRAMENAIYAGGQGQNDARVIGSAADQGSIGLDPWNRHEAWVDARNSANPASVTAEARAELRLQRIKKTFGAQFADTPGIKYGRDFGFGDKVTTNWDNEKLDVRVDSVGIKVENGQETLNIILRSDG